MGLLEKPVASREESYPDRTPEYQAINPERLESSTVKKEARDPEVTTPIDPMST